jgi:hypothetical protein
MGPWYRVFGAGADVPNPAALLAYLDALGLHVEGRFQGDADQWWSAEIVDAEGGATLVLERFLASEEGIRAELNSWAAHLETCEANDQQGPLMERMIQTRQLFTLHPSEDASGDRLCVAVCGWLARQTDGVWQADGQGFFAADGTLLLREC